jgi:hypothetical protein
MARRKRAASARDADADGRWRRAGGRSLAPLAEQGPGDEVVSGVRAGVVVDMDDLGAGEFDLFIVPRTGGPWSLRKGSGRGGLAG